MAQLKNERIKHLHKVPTFKVMDVSELTTKKVQSLINTHGDFLARYELLFDYYIGKHVIQNRDVDPNKPNNKLVNNFAEYITNVKNGYFMGKPVTYQMKDTAIMDDILNILVSNNEEDNNSELSKLASIYGHAFEYHWVDKDGNPRFKYVPPTEMFMVYGVDVEETPIGAIRYYITGTCEEKTTYAELYTSEKTVYFKGEGKEDLIKTKEIPHIYKDIPVVEFKNNDERLGDFENVITLIDAYEVVLSDSVNEVQYFNDAYLVIRNLLMTDESDIHDMKNNRIITLDENGEAEWLVKEINDGHIQNVLNRIQKDIHRFSETPSLTDEEFSGNLSGVAIKFKLWGLEQDSVNKERKFKKGLQKRFELLSNTNAVKTGKSFDWKDVKIKFTRNIPTNVLEQSQIVANVNGVVTKRTLLSILPFVENVNDELEELEKEEQGQIEKFGFVPEVTVNNTGTPNDGISEAQKDENGVKV